MTKNNDESSIVPYYNAEYSKSNFLIGAKYRSSLLENKIMAISLSKIQNAEEDPKNGVIYSRLKASELRELLNANGGSFYKQLDEAADRMTGKSIGMSDPEKQTFDYIAVVTRAHYEDGVLTLEYNYHLKEYLRNIEKNFTMLNLPVMLSFKNVYSFRLYELLKSRAYYPKHAKHNNENVFKIEFSLAELKFALGIVNSELDAVRRVLRNKENPNYEKALEVSPEKMFETWYDFKKKVLEAAKKEINEKTDIHIEYETETAGRGGKVHKVVFLVQLLGTLEEEITDEIVEEKPIILDEDKDAVLDQIMALIDYPIKIVDIRKIAESAEYNYAVVEKAYRVMEASNKNIDNVVGFLITAIKEKYEMPVKYNNKKSDMFKMAQVHQYNFEELEQQLLDAE